MSDYNHYGQLIENRFSHFLTLCISLQSRAQIAAGISAYEDLSFLEVCELWPGEAHSLKTARLYLVVAQDALYFRQTALCETPLCKNRLRSWVQRERYLSSERSKVPIFGSTFFAEPSLDSSAQVGSTVGLDGRQTHDPNNARRCADKRADIIRE